MHSNSPVPETHVKLPGFPTALPIIGAVDLRTGKVGLNPQGMVLLLTRRPTKGKDAQQPGKQVR